LSLQLDDVELSMGMSGDFEQAVRLSAVDSCVLLLMTKILVLVNCTLSRLLSSAHLQVF